MSAPRRLYVKPNPAKPGIQIPMHLELIKASGRRMFLPAEGAWVPDNQYHRRRLRDQDTVEATPPAEGDQPAAPTIPEATPPAAPAQE